MAEQNKDQEKTEKASPRRKEEAKKEGQVAKSQDVTSVTVLFACLTLFYFSSIIMVKKMMGLMRWMFVESGQFNISCDSISPFLATLVYKVCGLLFPLFLTVVCAALIANLSQVGFMFSSKAIEPKLSKIDPIKGFQRLFSLRSLVELLKNFFKISIVGFVAYVTVKGEINNLIPLGDRGLWGILVYMGRVAMKVMFRTCWVLVILAILDYAFQKWEHEKNLRMSKQEVKDEIKQSEGDPLIKARIKRIQREMARKRMMAGVPEADVVITNPTHIAVAIKYDQSSMSAPKVVAKGRGFIAERIKDIAGKNNIPIVENKPLAQVLNKIVNVDEMIPVNLYKAVAEILAYVYGLKTKKSLGYE